MAPILRKPKGQDYLSNVTLTHKSKCVMCHTLDWFLFCVNHKVKINAKRRMFDVHALNFPRLGFDSLKLLQFCNKSKMRYEFCDAH